MGKAFMWTFVGFCLGLAVVELTDGKPAEKVDYNRMYFNTRTIYRPYPNYYYDRRVDTFNNQRPDNQGNSRVETTGRSHSGNGNTFNHTPQQRTESWGTKN